MRHERGVHRAGANGLTAQPLRLIQRRVRGQRRAQARLCAPPDHVHDPGPHPLDVLDSASKGLLGRDCCGTRSFSTVSAGGIRPDCVRRQLPRCRWFTITRNAIRIIHERFEDRRESIAAYVMPRAHEGVVIDSERHREMKATRLVETGAWMLSLIADEDAPMDKNRDAGKNEQRASPVWEPPLHQTGGEDVGTLYIVDDDRYTENGQ